MKKLTLWNALVAATVMAPLLALSVLAQQRMGMGQGMPKYDPAAETTVKGTVEEVKQMSDPMEGMGPMGGMMEGMAGTHLSLKVGKETIDVHLGPSRFLEENKFAVAKGDLVEITGSKMKYAGGEALLAREVKKGVKTLTLRDKQGVPKWSMGRGRP